jgi:ATP-dependent Clp protease ATP-binding subunit ClpA
VLTDAIRRRPYQLVLLDEFEKAHREVSNLLLQVFDEGRLTDSHGRMVDFRNTVIIMTSNLGSDMLAKYDAEVKNQKTEFERTLSQLSPEEKEQKELEFIRLKENKKEIATKLVHQQFSPEFVNRLDDVVVFNSLAVDGIMKICSLQLNKVTKLLKEKNIHFRYSEKAAEQIALSGSNLQYGARPLKRLIQNEILSPLASKILNGEVKNGDELYISMENDAKDFMNKILIDKEKDDEDDKYDLQFFNLELSKDLTLLPKKAAKKVEDDIHLDDPADDHSLAEEEANRVESSFQPEKKEKRRLEIVIRRPKRI